MDFVTRRIEYAILMHQHGPNKGVDNMDTNFILRMP